LRREDLRLLLQAANHSIDRCLELHHSHCYKISVKKNK
jgi:hypothetical protein